MKQNTRKGEKEKRGEKFVLKQMPSCTFSLKIVQVSQNNFAQLLRFLPMTHPDQTFGVQSNKERQKVFTCLNTSCSLSHSWGITKKWLHVESQETG